ncbi:putative reverse transcriptase domain-containing protein [Tanacetum coccineum]
MQAARDRQKSYADLKRKPMEFQVGDKVMLKVSPWKGVVRFGKRGKLNPRVSDEPLAVPLDGLHLDDKLHFVEEPLEIVGREVKRLKRSRIPLVKVRWNSKRGPEFTWEREDQFKKKYPHLFIKTAPSSSAALWLFKELDVKNAFLYGHLTKTVYMHQPLGFVDPAHPNHVCLLQKSLYGRKQALRAWFQCFATYDIRSTYAREVLERAGMLNCNASSTPIATESKLSPDGDPVSDLTLYRSLAGSLQYLTFTRPDISYAFQQLIRMPTRPVAPSLRALPQYHGVTHTIAETAWVRNLLRELQVPLHTSTLVYYDNVSAVYLSSNPVQHQHTKHIEIDIHFVRDLVATGHIEKLVEGTENVENVKVDSSTLRRNDTQNDPDTRLEPISNKESLEVEITVEVQPVNINEEEEDLVEDDYELKRREKGKNVEESRYTPSLTTIRSPRIHSTLIYSDTEKIQELTVNDLLPSFSTPSSFSLKFKLSITNRLLSLFKPKTGRFKRYKSFFDEWQGHYGYLFEHLKTRFMSRKKFNVLAQHLQEIIEESLPKMVDDQVNELTKIHIPVYVA